MRSSDRWLAGGARLVRGPLVITVGLGIAAGVFILVQTSLVVAIVNGAVFEGRTISDLRTLFVGALAVMVARAATQYAAGRAGYHCAARVKRSVRSELVSRLRVLGPVRLAAEHSGELAGTIVDGVAALEPYFSGYLPQRAVAAILPFLILAIAYPLDWISGIIFTITAVFIPVLMILIGEEARAKNQQQWTALSRMSSRLLDIIQGLPTLKIFGAARREAATIRRISEEHLRATMQVVRIAFVSSLMLELITTLSIALVAITTGFRLLHGTLGFRTAYFVLLIAPEFYQPLRTMGTHHHARMGAAAAAERIHALLGGTDERRAAADSPRLAAATRDVPSVRFGGVDFSYAGARGTALTGVTFSIEAGEHVAIVGESGAGKSTIFSLLLGFVDPGAGTILVGGRRPNAPGADGFRAGGRADGRAGWHADEWDRESLRRRIAWMPQRPTIFPGTIRDNIRIARRDATDSEVEAAAATAELGDFVAGLPAQFETPVGERGYGLSGGEIQRIGLARVFLRDASLLLLDEPGSHLDRGVEARVFEAVRRHATGKTMLVIAHRPSALDLCERAIVLEGGRVTETGEVAELAKSGIAFRRLMSGFEVDA